MSQPAKAFIGADIHDGQTLHSGCALLVLRDGSARIVPQITLPQGLPTHDLAGGVILPGFVDLQVNGGGGVMFNDDQSVEALRSVAKAHRSLGTAAFLPTLITDTPARTRAAIDAVAKAIDDGVPGIAGLHLEGPHLSIARKGAHDPALIRPMTDDDLALLVTAAHLLPHLMLTVAPENCTSAQIKRLAKAGIIVSLGHTDASYDACMRAFEAGATCATHLFNAMSQLGNRSPGLVGAVLSHGEVFAGLIVDGIHVHPASLAVALSAETCNHKRLFLVTDAMATAGSDITSFTLNGREIQRRDGRLTLADGTLAGADLDMTTGLAVLTDHTGQPLETAIHRTTALPGQVLGADCAFGRFTGQLDGLIHLSAAGSPPVWLT